MREGNWRRRHIGNRKVTRTLGLASVKKVFGEVYPCADPRALVTAQRSNSHWIGGFDRGQRSQRHNQVRRGDATDSL